MRHYCIYCLVQLVAKFVKNDVAQHMSICPPLQFTKCEVKRLALFYGFRLSLCDNGVYHTVKDRKRASKSGWQHLQVNRNCESDVTYWF